MTIKKFNEIVEKYHLPEDTVMQSDSGWECGETEMDGIWYNDKDHIIIFTQGYYAECKEPYCTSEDWTLLYSAESEVNDAE